MALLGRHAAIYRLGTDEFTGNILFAVFFILLIGLFFSIQPVFEAIFKRLFSQRTSSIVVAEMPNGNHVALPVNEESVKLMQCTSSSPIQEYDVCEEDVEFADESVNSEFEVLKTLDGLRHVRFTDGSEAYVGEGLSDEEVMAKKAYFDNANEDYNESSSTIRGAFLPHGNSCPSFDEYMDGKTLEEVEATYPEWLSLQPKDIQDDIKQGNTHVRVNPQYSTPVGCFSLIGFENRIPQENGKLSLSMRSMTFMSRLMDNPIFSVNLKKH